VSNLKTLKVLLSPTKTDVLGANNSALAKDITLDLLDHDLYTHLSGAIKSIVSPSPCLYYFSTNSYRHQPVEAHSSSAALPLILSLTTFPLSIFGQSPLEASSYQRCLSLLFTHIFTIPLPTSSLTQFSSHLPLLFDVLSPSIPHIIASCPTPEFKWNLIANLFESTQPLYPELSLSALYAYLQLLSDLMNALGPIESFETPSTPLDPYTQERLTAISEVKHLKSLVTVSNRGICTTEWSLASFLLSLGIFWPGKRGSVLSTLLVCTDGGCVRKLYRGFVRNSPLGRDYYPKALMGMDILPHFLVLLIFTNDSHRPIFRIRVASPTLAFRPLCPMPPVDERRRILLRVHHPLAQPTNTRRTTHVLKKVDEYSIYSIL
jgi:ubiquitin-protein ligase E3 C